MGAKTYLVGARAVLADREVDAAVLIEDGHIAAIDPKSAPGADEIDLRGRLLLPGLVDLHCDAVEKDIEPRPGVLFPIDLAVAQADKRNAAAGITTAYHALSFNAAEIGVRDVALAAEIARHIHGFRGGLIDNRVHCRYEITDPEGVTQVVALIEDGAADLVSLMDHTPGQGQFKDVASFRDYLARTYDTSAAELDDILARKRANAGSAAARIEAVAAAAKACGLPLASHDDDSPARVQAMAALGTTISEFPIDLETAKAARAAGLEVVFGAPNLVRGASQSGALKALDAVRAGAATCLCSDYTPAMLLAGAFVLVDGGVLSWPDAARLVSLNPARAAGLGDRGEIALGKRADLIAVDAVDGWPRVERLWVAGREAYRARYAG
jgi:alpha-D-ribose 1-methylphosphonate 5-triphosphate diphosphatase